MSVSPQIEALRAKLREHGAAGFLTLDADQQLWLTGFRTLVDARPVVLLIGGRRSMLIVPEAEERDAREHARVDCVKTYGERHEQLLGALLETLAEGAPIAVDEQRLPLVVADQLRAHGHEPLAFNAVVRELADVHRPRELAAPTRSS